MRGKIPAGITLALALLIPAGPAVAATGTPKAQAAACQPIVVYTDLRKLINIDLDTAPDRDVRVLTGQILTAATANSLVTLPGVLQTQLSGTPDDLRTFLKTRLQTVWSVDLRIATVRTLTDAGPNAAAAADQALDTATLDSYLGYLNDGWFLARAADAGTVTTYTDIRTLIHIDLDTATDLDVRVQAAQLLSAADDNALGTLAAALQTQLRGTPDQLRTFLKTKLTTVWSTDLRVAVGRTLKNAGPDVKAAEQQTLATATIDAYLAFLNHGLYSARAADCVI